MKGFFFFFFFPEKDKKTENKFVVEFQNNPMNKELPASMQGDMDLSKLLSVRAEVHVLVLGQSPPARDGGPIPSGPFLGAQSPSPSTAHRGTLEPNTHTHSAVDPHVHGVQPKLPP